MAAATQLAMSASSFLCPTAIASKKVGSSNTQYFVTPTTLVVCQQDNKERKTADVSRRIFAAVATSVTALGVFVQPEAQAKRNKPVEEKKKEETEDKSLSAYDARLLANAKRKEAMKAKIDAAKAAANPIASAEK
ncbi:uncharacterized protein [Physcomitrium patens]|uniref:Uncharacterized protein n=1 Tax=Physcomitrium patens TaxID=3218 RepID=A9RP59_PHYPA|nr:uncharacterized protein LOC112296072 [Physcomitrium patens]XP_024403977.1 uncharacterized protein LOC112296072 [Physcomitrium patens]PNR34238.1 hypothetical protein PHYPA_024055 [Physcomitrium patens]|eukprot:XP_024403976.1 uncharacterized protein LOC112296072 [Physcomitrella patens]